MKLKMALKYKHYLFPLSISILILLLVVSFIKTTRAELPSGAQLPVSCGVNTPNPTTGCFFANHTICPASAPNIYYNGSGGGMTVLCYPDGASELTDGATCRTPDGAVTYYSDLLCQNYSSVSNDANSPSIQDIFVKCKKGSMLQSGNWCLEGSSSSSQHSSPAGQMITWNNLGLKSYVPSHPSQSTIDAAKAACANIRLEQTTLYTWDMNGIPHCSDPTITLTPTSNPNPTPEPMPTPILPSAERCFEGESSSPLQSCSLLGFKGCVSETDIVCIAAGANVSCIEGGDTCGKHNMQSIDKTALLKIAALEAKTTCSVSPSIDGGSGVHVENAKVCGDSGTGKPFPGCLDQNYNFCKIGPDASKFCVPPGKQCSEYGAQAAVDLTKIISPLQLLPRPIPTERALCQTPLGYVTGRACRKNIAYKCSTQSDKVCSYPSKANPISTFCIPADASCGVYNAEQISAQTAPPAPIIIVIKDELPFKGNRGCKNYYGKIKNEIKKKRNEYRKFEVPEDRPELEILIESYGDDSKQFLDEALNNPACDAKTYKELSQTIEELEDLSVSIDEAIADVEEASLLVAFPMPSPDLVERAVERGFNEQALRNRPIGAILNSCFVYPWFETLTPSVKDGLENLQFVPKKYQAEFVEGKTVFCEKIDKIVAAMEDTKFLPSEQDEILSAVTLFLKTHWDKGIAPLVGAKLDQIVGDLQKGAKTSQLEADLKEFYEKRVADNNFELQGKGVAKFCDVNNAEWFFRIFQDPQQIAFKGSGCSVYPTEPLKASEALVALMRALKMPLSQEAVAPDNVKDVPEWAQAYLNTAVETLGGEKGKREGVKELRLEDHSMAEPVSRETFALWIWKLSQEEPIAQSSLRLPTNEEVVAAKADFQDLKEFSKDSELLEAVAFVRIHGFMTGKKQGVFGTGSLLRAEAAKVLLLLSRKLST